MWQTLQFSLAIPFLTWAHTGLDRTVRNGSIRPRKIFRTHMKAGFIILSARISSGRVEVHTKQLVRQTLISDAQQTLHALHF